MKTRIFTLLTLLVMCTAGTFAQEKKILVAYFSWSGNTQHVAEYIARQTGATLFRIEPAKPYPTDYTPCTEVAKAEKEQNARHQEQSRRLGQLRHRVHRLPRLVVDRPDDYQHLHRKL